MRLMLLLFMAICAGSIARAEVYEWTDGKGVVHFTDDPDKVPARSRKQLKIRESVSPDREIPAVRQQPSPETAVPEKKAELYGGHGENWWRGRFHALRDEMKAIQDKILEKKDNLLRIHRKWVISMGRSPKAGETRADRFIRSPPKKGETRDENDPFSKSFNPGDTSHALGFPGALRAEYYKLKDEIEKDEARIKEIEQELVSVDAEATKAGVPFEWRK